MTPTRSGAAVCVAATLWCCPVRAERWTLSDVIAHTLSHSPAVVRAEADLQRAESQWSSAVARWEPTLMAGGSRSDDRTLPTTSIDGGAGEVYTTSALGLSAGLSQELPTGTELGLDFVWARADSTLGSALSPSLSDTRLQFSLRQPLLRGFAFDPRIFLKDALTARIGLQEAQALWYDARVELVRQAQDAYWGLELAREALEVQRGSMALGDLQLELCRRRIDAGTLPASDLIQAESAVAARRVALLAAEEDVAAAEDRLRLLLLRDGALPQGPLELEQELVTPSQLPTDAAEVRRSPAVLAAEARHERAELQRRMATQDSLPSLWLDVRLDVAGQGAAASEALSQLGAGEARGARAGLQLTCSPFLRRHLAELGSARAESRAAAASLGEARLRHDVATTAARRALDGARARVAAAEDAQRLALASLDVEERRFADGLTSSFFVAERQDDLARARLMVLSARYAERRAEAELRALLGLLLDAPPGP